MATTSGIRPGNRLCSADELPENTARGFIINSGGGQKHLFVVKKDGLIRAYENRCPHTGVNLDWQPDQFLDATGTLIQCATHGALFRIEDGLCIHGPCVNQSLTPVPVREEGGELIVTPLRQILPD